MSAPLSPLEKADQLPPNRVARSLLEQAGQPSSDREMLHLLALALWGLEQGISPEDNSPEPFDRDALAGTISSLASSPVAQQLSALGWPNDPPEMNLRQSPSEAAQEVLNLLWAQLSPTLPEA